ncbi:MAG: hypothetical protein JWL71_5338, partial [Acidobacteria bacterium]|nr:hypothetical protein [Acidobacteriota bacterium]
KVSNVPIYVRDLKSGSWAALNEDDT